MKSTSPASKLIASPPTTCMSSWLRPYRQLKMNVHNRSGLERMFSLFASICCVKRSPISFQQN